MRYLFLTGVSTLVLAGGLAIIKAGDVFAQQPRAEFVPVQVTGPGGPVTTSAFISRHVLEGESDEATQLNNRDAQLGQQAESLVKQIADASDDKERTKLRESLQETLAEQFDTQQKVRELEVAAIEARVKKLRDVINKRNDARRSIIDKRLDQLVREAEGLGWNSPGDGSGVYGPTQYGYQVRGGWSNLPGYGGEKVGYPAATSSAAPRGR